MPVHCTSCSAPAERFYFRPSEKMGHTVKMVRILLIVAGVLAWVDAVLLLMRLMPMLDLSDQVAGWINDDPDATFDQALWSDVALLVSNFSGFLSFLTVIVIGYLPIRFTLILARFKAGAPKTLRQIRALALLSIGLSVFLLFTWAWMFAEMRTVVIAPPITFNFLIAPVLLFFATRKATKEYFSEYEMEGLPASFKLAEARAPAQTAHIEPVPLEPPV